MLIWLSYALVNGRPSRPPPPPHSRPKNYDFLVLLVSLFLQMTTFLGEDFFFGGGGAACQLKMWVSPYENPRPPPPLENPSYATDCKLFHSL